MMPHEVTGLVRSVQVARLGLRRVMGGILARLMGLEPISSGGVEPR